MIFSIARTSSTSSLYLFSLFTTTTNLEHQSKMDLDSFIFKTSNSALRVWSFIFFSLSTPWREFYKISNSSFEVVTSATFSNMSSSKHWWTRVRLCWSFFLIFNKTSLSFEGEVSPFAGFVYPLSSISQTSWEPRIALICTHHFS